MKHAITLVFAVAALAGCAHKKRTATVPPPPPAPSGASTPAQPGLQRRPDKSARNTKPDSRLSPPTMSPDAVVGYSELGVASWYGHPYHGRAAADGEIYDMEKLVAAHRTLPFDTWVKVENLNNGKSIEVRIIDRGPFVDGRIIDLSHAAAKAIDLIGPGIAKVRLDVIKAPPDVKQGVYVVQVGAFEDWRKAENARAQMEAKYGAARLLLRDGPVAVWRVLVGSEPNVDAAKALADKIRHDLGEKFAFVIRLDS